VRITRLLLLGAFCVAGYAAAQTYGTRVLVRRKLPDDLQSSLEERFSRFIAAQVEDHREELAELLGTCARQAYDGKCYKSYTASYKLCMVERMQEVRMLDFDFSTQNLFINTTFEEMEPIDGPVNRFAAERSPWHTRGTGRFQTSSESWMQQIEVIGYRDQGQWYFIPPQRWMQDKWERAHYTAADFATDRQAEIEVRNNPSSPVEITDLHVYMQSEHPSDRNISFKLRNKTSKKITVLTVSLHEGDLGEELRVGSIEAKGQLVEKDREFMAYDDFCDGIIKHTMFIQHVDFADGSRWEFQQPTKPY
jgi:hypothetical protein